VEVIVLRFGGGNYSGLPWAEERAGDDADEAGEMNLRLGLFGNAFRLTCEQIPV
jgi:hypothetical protein